MMWSTAVLSCASWAVLVTAQVDSSLPIVDMGHRVHQAITYDVDGNYYNFSNIRYGEPPVGNLRFAAPVAATADRRLQRGHVNRICHQAAPAWLQTTAQFVPAYLAGTANVSELASNLTPPPTTAEALQIPPKDPSETEDCLFLDVIVPKKIYDGQKEGVRAPVLVWFFGGGYVFGSKQSDGNPAGLIARSQDESTQGVVYVQINYRLGAFGWLSGPTFEGSGGKSNAGLLDQRLALDWIQHNIDRFGGDPRRVTVFGQSAGGGSIEHHITSNGGRGPVPFQQAILQSPGFQPVSSRTQQEKIFQGFLKTLGVGSLQEARGKSEEEVTQANTVQVGLAPYGQFLYGPVVDGTYVTDLPGRLLLAGRFAKDIKVMAGHNANEGLTFSSPYVQDNGQLEEFVRGALPGINSDQVNYVTGTLYPAIFDGSQGYRDQFQRQALIYGDVAISCNTNYLGRAYGGRTYNYLFSVPPAVHRQDLSYTFYNGPNPLVISDPVAIALQNYIVSFAQKGTPNKQGVPVFDLYGPQSRVKNLDVLSISDITDPAANERCTYWQKGYYT